MKKTAYMNISEFSRLTGIKRANLIFYDKVGLLKAEHRSDNNYRLYTQHQLKTAFVIFSLRAIDVPIDEIKNYINQQTPEKMIDLFEAQEKYMQEEIVKLKHRKAMMKLQREMVLETKQLDTSMIHIIDRHDEPIFLGEKINEGISEDKAMLEFYDYVELNGIDMSSPMGALVSKDMLCSSGIPKEVQQFYMKIVHKHKDKKPAGRYVVGFSHGDYGKNVEALYQRLFAFIQENHLKICGDAYEEYPLFEMTTKDPNQYLVRIEIMIE